MSNFESQSVRALKHPSDRRGRLARSLSLCIVGAMMVSGAEASSQPLGPPPEGHAGECFQEVTVPAVYRAENTSVAQPPLITYRKVPAVFKPVQKQVVATPAQSVWETIPATYKTVAKYSEAPGDVRMIRTPAVYRTVTTQTVAEPAHMEWRRNRAAPTFSSQGGGATSVIPTGEVLCRVMVPARYVMARQRVLAVPAGYRKVRGPTRRIVCYVKVVDQPARKVEHKIAAVFKTVTVNQLVTPAARQKIESPRPPKVICRQVLVTPAHKAWRRIECKPHRG